MLTIQTSSTKPRGSLTFDGAEFHFAGINKTPLLLSMEQVRVIIRQEIKHRRDHTIRLLLGTKSGPEIQRALSLGLQRLRELNEFAEKTGL
jgi:hypothetical protein